MLINLSDVLSSEGRVATATADLEMTSFTSRMGEFPITEKSPAAFTFTNIGVGKAKVEGGIRLVFMSRCDRCLAEVPVTLELKFDRTVTSPDAASGDAEEEDLNCMEGYQLNAEAFVYNEILVNWPMKVLCKEDCRGVCPKCGQNLNAGDCGCDTFVPDPRMAVIKDIFDANKEV